MSKALKAHQLLLAYSWEKNVPSLDKTRNGGGSCMFNSLAYNCDFQDAIGNHVTDNTSLSLSTKEKNSKLNLFLHPGAAHEAAYWGSSSPGKRSGGPPFPKSSLKTFPKNSQRDLAGYQRRSPDGVAHKHHLPSIAWGYWRQPVNWQNCMIASKL